MQNNRAAIKSDQIKRETEGDKNKREFFSKMRRSKTRKKTTQRGEKGETIQKNRQRKR